jgi:hypothetical protein
MKKFMILYLSFLVFTLVFGGCETPLVKTSDKQLINTAMSEWKVAFEAKDLNRLMKLYSENYLSSTGSSKLAMRERMAGAIERGSFDDVKVKIQDAKINTLGNQATFGPVEITLDRETLVLEYTLQKEESKWLIVNSKRKKN